MEYGFVKTAAVSPKIRVADPVYNGTEIIRLMKETWEKGARIIVFPELCITGYTCSDLFRQELLLKTAKEVLMEIVEASAGMDGLFFVGLPLENPGKLYNVASFNPSFTIYSCPPFTRVTLTGADCALPSTTLYTYVIS